jgi:uncharacterized protein
MTDDGAAPDLRTMLEHGGAYTTRVDVLVGGRKVCEVDGVVYELRPVAPRKPRGLAAVSPERRAEIARSGGRATAKSAKAVRWTSETARAAGRKGGAAMHRGRGAEADHLASAAE